MRGTSTRASRRVRLPPPVQEWPRRLADRDEPEIVHADGQHEETVDVALVVRIRPHRVRREHDAVCGGEIGNGLERVENPDVGVEVDDLAPTVVEQAPEQQRLDRGRQLRDVVDAGQAADLGRVETDVAQPEPDDPVVDGRARRKPSPLVIDKQDREPAVRMVRQKRIGEHLRERKVVTRYDCARVQHGWRPGDSLIVLPTRSLGRKALIGNPSLIDLPLPPLEFRHLVGPTAPRLRHPVARTNLRAAPGARLRLRVRLRLRLRAAGPAVAASRDTRPRRYLGIDPHSGMVEWCRVNISRAPRSSSSATTTSSRSS